MKVLVVVLGIMIMVSRAGFALTYQETVDSGLIQLHAEKYIEGEKTFKDALILAKTNSEKASALSWIAQCLMAQYQVQGKLTEAINTLETMITLPDGFENYKGVGYSHIGFAYNKIQDGVNTRVNMDKVLALTTSVTAEDKAFAQTYRGHSYFKEKNYVSARAEYAKVAAHGGPPNYEAESLYSTGESFKLEKNLASAFVNYKDAFKKGDNDLFWKKKAFNKLIELQLSQVTDWKAYCDWLTQIAVSIPATTQEQADFAGIIISERDKLKKIYGIP